MLSIPALIAEAVDEGGLPPRPPETLDPYLDAVEACVTRYGWSRTSPKDIAREAGVERTTIYRNLGPKDEIFRLLIAREVHRLIDWAAGLAISGMKNETPAVDVLIELVASAIEELRSRPMTAKLLEDEPELVASFIQHDVPDVIERFSGALGPVLELVMKSGRLADRDPALMTEWMVRMGLSLLFAPPRADLRDFLEAGIRPLFTPEADR